MANMKQFVFALLVLAAFVPVISAVSYDCKGSSLCKNMSPGNCDTAEREIVADNLYFTDGDRGETGTCDKHCGLFVQGKLCQLSGSEMTTAYNELRANGCRICGSKTFDDGCQFTINYVTGC